MSKRMTDTGKWDKEWFIDLPIKMKCLWFYMLDKCDLAGIWDVNFKSASFHIGQPIKEDEALRFLGGQISKINEKYWLIIDFIRFQNGWPLNEKSPVHKKIIELLNQKGIELTENNTLYHRVSDRVLDRGIVIVTVESSESNKGGEGGKKVQPPISHLDLTDELKESNYHLYRIGKMLLDNCNDVMQMKYPMSFVQLQDLIKKYGAETVDDVLKAMQNKGIKYLSSKGQYAFLTAESWIKIRNK